MSTLAIQPPTTIGDFVPSRHHDWGSLWDGIVASPSSDPAESTRSGDDALPAQSASSESPAHTPPGPPQDGCNLFVAGLSPTVGDAELEAAFKPFGFIVSAKVMLHVDTAASRGFGFVLFDKPDAANAARIALAGQPIPGHGGRLQVSLSNHRGENLATDTCVVYVRNIPVGCSVADIQRYFGTHGTVQQVQLRNLRPSRGANNGRPGAKATEGLRSLVINYSTPAEAKACVLAVHGNRPLPGCTTALLAKLEEPQELRDKRLKSVAAIDNSVHSGSIETAVPSMSRSASGLIPTVYPQQPIEQPALTYPATALTSLANPSHFSQQFAPQVVAHPIHATFVPTPNTNAFIPHLPQQLQYTTHQPAAYFSPSHVSQPHFVFSPYPPQPCYQLPLQPQPVPVTFAMPSPMVAYSTPHQFAAAPQATWPNVQPVYVTPC